MLRPARWLGRLTSPRLRFRTDRPARFRQSLPRPESPPARVCYHYSAQPPISEAGFSPARVSKNEGCTRRKRRQRSEADLFVSFVVFCGFQTVKTDFDLCLDAQPLRDQLWLSRGDPEFWTLLQGCDERVRLQPS